MWICKEVLFLIFGHILCIDCLQMVARFFNISFIIIANPIIWKLVFYLSKFDWKNIVEWINHSFKKYNCHRTNVGGSLAIHQRFPNKT